MMQGLIGRKLGMTQTFTEGDFLVPVTVVQAGPCVVSQIKTEESDGYDAIQIGFETRKDKHSNKAEQGHFAKAGVGVAKTLKEIRVDDPAKYKLGQTLNVESFAAGEKADVTAVSKGKGFSGVIKRWNFSGGPGGHGSHLHRGPGSIGMAASPSRVIKGKKMPGQYGNVKKTVTNLEIIKVVADQNILLIKGAVPGANGAIVFIRKSERTAG
ncbi:MAG: 50S ribosomal protein L3 [Actinomycetia bacterium]|nr:50S ribosomal protein L3 [Actinomycetes bacterium]